MKSEDSSSKYSVLVIDDDPAYHHMFKALLKNEFEMVAVESAQKAIDTLAERPVNLIIADIHMPGMTGLELLESLKIDTTKRDIPMLIITSLPNPEVEQEANNLGAADFIRKSELISNKQEVLERVRMKLVSSVEMEDLNEDLDARKQAIVSSVMNEAIKGDVNTTIEHLCTTLAESLDMSYTGFWKLDEGEKLLETHHFGSVAPQDEEVQKAADTNRLKQLLERREAEFNNHISGDEQSLLPRLTREHQLIFEGVIPLFALSERELLMNRKQMPEDSRLFSLLVLKRKNVCSTKEFQLVKRVVQQLGSIIWRLYRKEQAGT